MRMLGLVATDWVDRAWRVYQRNHVLRFAWLADFVQQFGEEYAAGVRRVQADLHAIRSLTAYEVLQRATPFFWQNVDRVHESASASPQVFAQACSYLRATGFDAFFHELPDCTSMSVDVEDSKVVLPALGIRVATRGDQAVLRRLGPDKVEIESNGGVHRIQLQGQSSTSGVRFVLPGHPGPSVIVERHPSLFEPAEMDEVSLGIDRTSYVNTIAEAIDLVLKVEPELYTRMCQMIRWYVPIHTDSLDVHHSSTTYRLTGVVFLSKARDHLIMAEAAVHEFLHNTLNVLAAEQPIFQNVAGEWFYSPWRDDPRPLSGLFHALFVFAGVAAFFARTERIPSLQKLHPYFRHRRQKLVQQLSLGLAQVSYERVSNSGITILETIREMLAAWDLDLVRGEADPSVEEHLRAWCQRHTDLAASVRTIL